MRDNCRKCGYPLVGETCDNGCSQIRRDSTEAQLADSFGRINFEEWRNAMHYDFPAWDKLAAVERAAWIAAAAAVRKAEQELR